MSKSLQFVPGRTLTAQTMFASLPVMLRERLRSTASPRRFGDGQIIQQRGDPARGFWLIEEGAVAIGQFLPEGEFRAVALLGPGDSYGELALLAGRPRIVDAVARGPAVLRQIDGTAFEREMMMHPEAMRTLLGVIASQLQEVLDLLAGLRRGTTVARAAALLANLAGEGHGPQRATLTQHELADLLGVSRVTANAALRTLERAGLIQRKYGTIEVPDVVRLRAVSLK